MTGPDMRELEVFVTLSDELHFGRVAQRLYLSQGRVSQLVGRLEHRVGGRLFERSSRRVRLTPLGERFLADLRPAYDGMRAAFQDARSAARGIAGRLRIGFTGVPDTWLAETVAAFRFRHTDCDVELYEVDLVDPFGAVQRGELDAVLACLPADAPRLMVGPVVSTEPVVLTVAAGHPLAARDSITAEELAGIPLLDVRGPAPRGWLDTMSPMSTPAGRPIPRGPVVRTFQEALTAIATGAGGLLFCRQIQSYAGRQDLAFVPVPELPDSRLALIWHRDRDSAGLRAFAELVDRGGVVAAGRPNAT